MLSDELRARVNAYADREWPHEENGHPDTNTARASRRLTFRRGVEWAMAHTTDEDFDTVGAEGLLKLPVGTVVRSAIGTIACRFDESVGTVFGDDRTFPWEMLATPARILFRPVPSADLGEEKER